MRSIIHITDKIFIAIMQKQYISMRFNRKVFIRSCKKYLLGNSQHFIDEKYLLISKPYVLDYSVRPDHFKPIVFERESPSIVNMEFLTWINLPHHTEILYPETRVVFRLKSEIL